MIYQIPLSWQELQNHVCTILNQVGFKAETSKTVETPRGKVELDVYAVDPFSIDIINYVIECKNWESKIPQTIIHAFTRVIQETGANIGYIISKQGFQSGAYDYIKFTNIKVFTFEEFQSKYIIQWFENYFCSELDNISDTFFQYTEIINSRRERFLSQLEEDKRFMFQTLKEKYFPLSAIILSLTIQSNKKGIAAFVGGISKLKEILPIEDFKSLLSTHGGTNLISVCYSDLLIELSDRIISVTDEFNAVFGKNIFNE